MPAMERGNRSEDNGDSRRRRGLIRPDSARHRGEFHVKHSPLEEEIDRAAHVEHSSDSLPVVLVATHISRRPNGISEAKVRRDDLPIAARTAVHDDPPNVAATRDPAMPRRQTAGVGQRPLRKPTGSQWTPLMFHVKRGATTDAVRGPSVRAQQPRIPAAWSPETAHHRRSPVFSDAARTGRIGLQGAPPHEGFLSRTRAAGWRALPGYPRLTREGGSSTRNGKERMNKWLRRLGMGEGGIGWKTMLSGSVTGESFT